MIRRVTTASVQSSHIIAYDTLNFRPIRLFSCIPFSAANRWTLTGYQQEILPIRTIRYQSTRSFHLLVTIFTLHTMLTYYNPNTKQSTTYHWQKTYRVSWRIPYYVQACDVDYNIVKQSLHPMNYYTARNDILLSVRILSERKIKQT
ncbi:MAG: hypothetical protein Q4G58_16515 [bacterium]|nr:hypothetical protein [bacterium]